MKRLVLAAVAVVSMIGGVALAQRAQGDDEKQIRALIAAEESGKRPAVTSDSIFWSGAYRRPFIRPARGEEVPGDERGENRVPDSQRTGKTVVRRIEIAKSGEMAYEYSDAELSFDLKNGRHVSFPRSILRVWKKEEGQWKVAASFSHQHDLTGLARK